MTFPSARRSPGHPAWLRRKSHAVLGLLAALGLLFLWTFADARRLAAERAPHLATQAALARRLALSDLTLFPEARYTRHLSQADLHSPFQDSPGALDHFPSGSLAPPPPALRQPDEAPIQ